MIFSAMCQYNLVLRMVLLTVNEMAALLTEDLMHAAMVLYNLLSLSLAMETQQHTKKKHWKRNQWPHRKKKHQALDCC